jgi:hypothetical protein
MNNTPEHQHSDGVKLTPEVKLQIQESVESRLERLPATTYRLIEEMVECQVARQEKKYRTIGIIMIAAITLVSVAFFKVTSDNASETVAKAIASTEVKKQALMVEKLLLESQDTKNKLVAEAVDGINAAESLKTRLHELEKIDNIVRYSFNGNLILTMRDGELRFRRLGSSKEIIMNLDTNGFFTIWDGKTGVDPIHGAFLLAPGQKLYSPSP